MKRLITGVLLLFIGIALVVGAVLLTRKMDYTDADTKEKCVLLHSAKSVKNGTKCGVWDGSQCRRAEIKDGKCVSKGSVLPLLLLVSGGLLVLIGLGVLISMLFRKK